MKKFLSLLIISIILILSLVSCGDGKCTEHTDENADGVCDSCNTALEPDGDGAGGEAHGVIELVKGGDALFSVLIASDAPSAIRDYANDLIRELNNYYIKDGDVATSYDHADLDPGTEIIIGSVNGRGDKFKVDTHYLGYEGFAIKVIDGKLFVIAGGNTGYRKALDYLKKDVLALDDFEDFIDDLSISTDTAYEKIQSDYDIESIKINSNDISDYVIAYGDTIKTEKSCALNLQEMLYKNAGVWLEAISIDKLPSDRGAIYVEYTGEDNTRRTDEGLVIYVDDDSNIHAECEFADLFDTTFEEALTGVMMPKGKKNVSLNTGTVYTKDVRNIYYESFGALGDGRTNDFEALKACHDYANKNGHTVNATKGKTYYIGRTFGEVITVRTDVNWNGAGFIIDDVVFDKSDSDRMSAIFKITSESAITYKPGDGSAAGKIIANINAAGGIDAKTCTKLDLGLGYPALLTVYNSNHQNYIRYGSHYEGGGAQCEIITVDKDGNIDPNARFMFDYTEITCIIAHRIDDQPITIDGGGATFTTIANQVPLEFNASGSPVYYYYYRNIAIERSNTVFKNVNHLITGELEYGAPYIGFISVSNTNNVLICDCVVTGHRNYSNMGSYDLGPGNSNNLTIKNVTQSNFFLDDGRVSTSGGYWGIMGSNYCKNMIYDGCTLTRFDAHKGVYNATVRNSTVAMINLIGAGTFTLENSTVYTGNSSSMITLRSDYGATWNGDFIIKDVTVNYTGTSKTFNLINGSWNNHYFGYACSAPTTVTVENLTVTSSSVKTISLATGTITNSHIFGGEGNLNPYRATEKLIIKRNEKNYSYTTPNAYETEIKYE